MGLYLCIFDENDEELDGVEVGSYADWGDFIDTIIADLEGGERGARCPRSTMHPDGDGEWSPGECQGLVNDLREIRAAFEAAPPRLPEAGSWQANVAREFGLKFDTLYQSFIDVDGENVIDRLTALAELARKVQRPILFQ